MRLAATLFLIGACVGANAAAAAQVKPVGTWEAARTEDEERMFVILKDMGKVEIVAEYDFSLPGQPGKRRGRSTSFGKWTMQGNDVIIAYSTVKDRLRYQPREPLAVLGLAGAAPALKPIGTPDPKSKIGALILWKAPHEYHVKAAARDAHAVAAPVKPDPLPAPAQGSPPGSERISPATEPAK
ncbi:MAG: hypothetical protein ABI612_13475 [Betaproteobacteria bacterium]